MSKVSKSSEPGREEDAVFHRVELKHNEVLKVVAGDKPTAIWIAANATVGLIADRDVVIDVSEVVEHEDVVSLDRTVRQLKMEERKAKRDARRAKRRLRRGERPVDGDKPKGEGDERHNR